MFRHNFRRVQTLKTTYKHTANPFGAVKKIIGFVALFIIVSSLLIVWATIALIRALF